MKIQISIRTEFGQYDGEILEVDQERYEKIKDASTGFFLNGFEMNLADGSFIVIPPEIIRKSILLIYKL
jgi:hypothetical protein